MTKSYISYEKSAIDVVYKLVLFFLFISYFPMHCILFVSKSIKYSLILH